jgi:hypothetical protein
MKFEGTIFPVYRKYKNNKSYFKIISPRLFEEIQLIGSKIKVQEVKAERLPEMNFVRDLVVNYSEMAEAILKEEYDLIRENKERF